MHICEVFNSFISVWSSKKRTMSQTSYYAVIFTSIKSPNADGYDRMSEELETLVVNQPGYLGHESARNEIGITVSYWKDLESIKIWKMNALHQTAQKTGRENWYQAYKIRICKVEREYGMGEI